VSSIISGLSGGKLAGGGVGAIIVIALMLFMGGGNTSSVLTNLVGGQTTQTQTSTTVTNSEEKEFVSVVLKDLEDYWSKYLPTQGYKYRSPKLVLYSGTTQTAGGTASKDMGPFYMPADETIYMDLSFAKDLTEKYGATKGDYTMAYVLAHEFGHHIQKLMGTSEQVKSQQGESSDSVRLELQADYYAGMFTKYLSTLTNNGKPVLEKGDFEEALGVAKVIGDDALQKKYTGKIQPETFTHGTSQERIAWLTAGYKYGDLAHGDTFKAKNLTKPDEQ
jgi:predicted metalloprotease